MSHVSIASPEVKPDRTLVQGPETVGKILAAKQVPKIVKVACRFAKARQRRTVVYILGFGDSTKSVDVPITRRTAEQLVNSLGDDRFDDLDLIIQSSGGDIHAAYLIMSMLRERMNKGKGRLVACVPSRAMSAATLLCLGADEILLGELGSLGPLDAQIRKGVTDAGTPRFVSALHLLKALSRLQEFSLDAFTAMASHLDAHQASHDDQIKYGIKYSQAIASPLFEHIESGEIGYWDQMLKTGEEYGRRLLKQGDLIMEDIDIDREEHIKSVMHQLVFEYPSHELIFDLAELEKLHLKCALIPNDAEKDQNARRISRQFAECASETLIMLVDPNGVPAPSRTSEISLQDWQSIGTDVLTRAIVWTDEGSTFSMQVGLYRPAVTPRNPWHEMAGRTVDDGPAAQYSVPLGYTAKGTQYSVPPGSADK